MIKNRRSFITGLKSTVLQTREKKFLNKYKPWGIILFSRNIKTIGQTKRLTDEIRKIFKDSKYPILIDQEGGRINRINSILETSSFSADFFGKLYKKSIQKFKIYQQIIDNVMKQIAIVTPKIARQTSRGENIVRVYLLNLEFQKIIKLIHLWN